MDVDHNYSGWGSRRTFIMSLLCQIIGTPTFIVLPNTAIKKGALGYIVGYSLCYIFLGIPLLYMEFVISQFTSRDCIDVWKSRPLLSHFGYIVVLWQVVVIIYNHMYNCFLLHYFLITFENPVPYFTCGPWRSRDCDILTYNHTVYEDCLRIKDPPKYCNSLHTSFPEYQYWRQYILGGNDKRYFYVAWQVCLASGLICIFMYICCFKRKHSVRWFVEFLTLYPIAGYTIIMIGSMLQVGIVTKYEEAIDIDLSSFFENFRMTHSIKQIIYALGIGSGITFNQASNASFHTPCYANIVITVVTTTAVTVLGVCTTAMIFCPYAYKYRISPKAIENARMTLIFEKVTRAMNEYNNKSLWLILTFSCHTMVGVGTNIIIILQLMELTSTRHKKISQYPELSCFIGITLIFFITIPMLSNIGMYSFVGFRRYANLVTIFFGIVENLVFVIWYGLNRISEDVHFMQGMQPGNYIKLCWLGSSILLGYVFCNELYNNKSLEKKNATEKIGWWLMVVCIGFGIIITLVKLLIAAFKNDISRILQLDPNWGPKNDVLKRSRTMFTAQAMTKEYMYRQYRLQAGILERQAVSNCRKQKNTSSLSGISIEKDN